MHPQERLSSVPALSFACGAGKGVEAVIFDLGGVGTGSPFKVTGEDQALADLARATGLTELAPR